MSGGELIGRSSLHSELQRQFPAASSAAIDRAIDKLERTIASHLRRGDHLAFIRPVSLHRAKLDVYEWRVLEREIRKELEGG